MNTVALCCCWHLAPYAMAPAPSGIVGIAPSRDPHGLGEAFPKLQPPTILHARGDKSQNPFSPESFQPGRASPRWAACLSTGGASAPVWGMNEPEGLSTPLWCGQVHCPYGHEPMASWSGFRGVWGGRHSPKTDLWCFSDFPEGGTRAVAERVACPLPGSH